MSRQEKTFDVVFRRLEHRTPHQVRLEHHAVNETGHGKHIAFDVSIVNEDIYQRLYQSECSGELREGQNITVTIVQEWDEHHSQTYLADFALGPSQESASGDVLVDAR